MGLKISLYKTGFFVVVVVLVNLLCNLVLSKAQMSVSWQSLLPAYPDAVDVLIEKFIVL